MKKQSTAASVDLETLLLSAAISRTAHVLRPYPEGVAPEALTAALESLREQKLIHGPMREPNLTQLGAEMARELTKEAA